jgi:hypothetical protein
MAHWTDYMTYMPSVAIRARIQKMDRYLIRHILLNGRVDDDRAKHLVGELIYAAMLDPVIDAVFAKNKIDRKALCHSYITLVRALMPNPAIKAVDLKPMLAPTIFFLEPWRLMALFQYGGPESKSLQAQTEFLDGILIDNARQTWITHATERGPVEFNQNLLDQLTEPPSAKGCIPLFIATGISVLSSAVIIAKVLCTS